LIWHTNYVISVCVVSNVYLLLIKIDLGERSINTLFIVYISFIVCINNFLYISNFEDLTNKVLIKISD